MNTKNNIENMISNDIDENILKIEDLFSDCGDLVKRKFTVGRTSENYVYIAYLDMLVDRSFIEQQVIDKIMIAMWDVETQVQCNSKDVFDLLKDAGIATADMMVIKDFAKVPEEILCGNTVFFVNNSSEAIILSTKGQPNRGVPTTQTEVVIQGSQEAFSEVFRINTMLIRRRIRDTKLKVKQSRIGRRSQTDVALMYLSDVVRPEILKDVEKRISNINIDAIMDVGYIEQLIEEDWMSPFPQAQTTERPDKAASAILEGRIVIVVDNSPFVLIVPSTLNVFFQSSEDYYQKWHITSFVRILRFICGFLAIALPGLYIATTLYHPSMIPMFLAFSFAEARATVPFPALIEILLMDIAFELLREGSVRLPSAIGSTIGIVGGLIIGQAAIEAGLVSPIVVIVVALAGVCTFTIPNMALVNSCRITKYLILFLSAFLGLLGFWVGLIIVLIHLCSLKTFGIPYMFPFTSSESNSDNDLKDSIIRMPLFMMKKRPIFANPKQSTKLDDSQVGIVHEKE